MRRGRCAQGPTEPSTPSLMAPNASASRTAKQASWVPGQADDERCPKSEPPDATIGATRGLPKACGEWLKSPAPDRTAGEPDPVSSIS
jgi:hypothetical protein